MVLLPDGVVVYIKGKSYTGSVPAHLEKYVPEHIQRKVPESKKQNSVAQRKKKKEDKDE